MSNQESQNQNKTTEEGGVDKKRRRFVAGASIAAPIILTLTSPSVFGGVNQACYSQQMSGNVSGTPGSCRTGVSPGFWRNPVGTVEGVDTIDAWTTAGFVYGNYDNKGLKQRCASYSGGTKFSEAFPGSGDNRRMREILCRDSHADKSSGVWHLVAAMLNAKFFNGTYILTPAQVIGIWNGSISVPPGYADLKTFLDSTWI